MVISGEWLTCDDGLDRPVIRGEVLTGNGSWIRAWFLVDTGADCTVLGGDILSLLELPLGTGSTRVGGLGGVVNSAAVETHVRFMRAQGSEVTFREEFTAVTDPEALDMSVLGRDITDLFSVIVDRPGDVVCLVSPRHRYQIVGG